MASIVMRDGQPVSPVLADENAAFVWLQKRQSMSVDWALKYEGYEIMDASRVDGATPQPTGEPDETHHAQP